METLLHVGLSNAVLALPLAVLAALCGAWGRRPALAHRLWLLVLLKLVTPPILTLPIPRLPGDEKAATEALPVFVAKATLEPVSPVEVQAIPADVPEAGREEPEKLPLAEAPAADLRLPAQPALAATPMPTQPEEISWSSYLLPWVLGLWLAGTASWVLIGFIRIGRFRKLLRYAQLASESVQLQAQSIAARLGLTKCPAVRLLPGPISPMLWGLAGNTVLLLPGELLDRLDSEQLATLLAHELAHYRRRDHWVRLLELVATGLYWWNPVVWWARHGLRDAEEQCCDAWVVWALPAAARAYADALVATVDFLSESRLALPPAASGIGHVRMLKRRLTMILQGMPSRKTSLIGTLVILSLGLLVLPWVADWALADEPPPPSNATVIRAVPFVAAPPRPGDSEKAAEIERAKNELVRMTMELERTHEQLRVAEVRMAEAQKRLLQLVGGSEPRDRLFHLEMRAVPGQPETRAVLSDNLDVLLAQLKGKEAQVAEAEAKLAQAKAQFARKKELAANGAASAEELDNAQVDLRIAAAQLQGKMAQLDEARALLEATRRRGDAGPVTVIRTSPVPPGTPPSAPAPVIERRVLGIETRMPEAADGDRRMRELEKKLGELLKEVEGLRQDMKRQAPAQRAVPAPSATPMPPRER